MPNRCECKLDTYQDFEKLFSYCPTCGSFLNKMFIGEKYLESNEDTPLRRLINHLIYERKDVRVKGKIISPKNRTDASLWSRIYKPIEESDICLFDVSEKRFNVAYELGFVMGNRKPIVIFSRPDCRPEFLTAYGFFDCPYENKYDKLIDLQILLDGMKLSEDKIETIQKLYFDEEIISGFKQICETIKSLFLKVELKSNYSDHYSKLDAYIGDKFPKVKNVVLITSKKNKEKFLSLKKEVHIDLDVICPEEITSFISDLQDIVLKIHQNFFYKYKFMIGHLLFQNEEENFQKHNFIVALLGGLMTHRGRDYCKFIAHNDNKIELFSDRQPEKYINLDDSKEIIKKIINDFSAIP